MTDKSIKKMRGFTLIELTIVMVIIGFLTAGVVAGGNLIKQAAVVSTIVNYNQYIMATHTFTNNYRYFPGDIPVASSYWPTALNGNGNNILGPFEGSNENLKAWNHLSLARLINENFPPGQSNPRPGLAVPEADITENAGFDFVNQTVYGVTANALALSLKGPSGAIWSLNLSALKVIDSATLDQKIDDGNPGQGRMVIYQGGDTHGSSTRCVDRAYTSPLGTTVNFRLNDTLISCRAQFYFDSKL